VLDIGAGNGVLSLPLCAIGCDVIAVEPSSGMRNLLYTESSKRGIDSVRVDNRRWEDFSDSSSFDLVLACNSLHLTTIGLQGSLKKIVSLRPSHIFVVGEQDFCSHIQFLNGYDYCRVFKKQIKTKSSFAYHSISEALEHWFYKKKRFPDPCEEREIRSRLVWRHNHFWTEDIAIINMTWWTLNNQDNKRCLLYELTSGTC
jgi:cyclopropane fatty-acyl-phospholipid synthase-like methyltransferase